MRSWREELSLHLRLALPTTVIQLGTIALNVVDVMMVGHHSARDLAAVAVGHAFAFGVMAFGLGVLLAVDPIVSQAVGAGDRPALARGLQRGLLLALLLSVPLCLAITPVAWVLARFGVQADIAPLAVGYALTYIPSLPAYLGFTVLRLPLQAMHRMRPIVVVTLLVNVANVGLNWVLIYGRFGLPALGAVGCGWSTAICRWLSFLGLLALAWPLLAPHLAWQRRSLELRPLLRVLRLGAPIGVQLALEIGGFGLIAIVMGRLGAAETAGHQIALNLASVTFMVPLAMSMAGAVRVGTEVGAGDSDGARRAAVVALVAGASVMACFALVFVLVPGPLARAFTPRAEVIAVAVVLIRLAAAFQVFDGVQVVCAGILRGVGETRLALLANLLGFWGFGLPVGLWLGFRAGLGPAGLWWGLVCGLAAVACALLVGVRWRLSRVLARLVFDHDEPRADAAPQLPLT